MTTTPFDDNENVHSNAICSDNQFAASPDFEAEYRERLRRIGRFNLALFGKTGAGKSTLVNAIFGKQVASTGIGKPVTKGTTYFEHPNGVFGMFDSEGFETGKDGDSILAGLRDEVKKRREGPQSQQMHVAWYVLRWSDRRFEDSQAQFVRELHSLGLPVIVVLSQVPQLPSGELHPDAVQFGQAVASEVADVIEGGRPILVNAVRDPHLNHPVHGLDELLDATFQAAPEGVRNALNAAQKIDRKRKRELSHAIIATATTAAGGIGLTPIPLSDAALLAPVQVSMMAGIAAQYALPVTPGTVARLVGAATLASGAASLGGRVIANLLKTVPVVGSTVGGVINAGVASTLTAAMGKAWMTVCEDLESRSPEEIEQILMEPNRIREVFLPVFKSQMKMRGDQAA